MFDEATGKHAVKAPDEATSAYGKPASILSDRGTRFYATESEKKTKGASRFERRLNDLGILHILARAAHPPDQRQAGAGARGDAAQAPPVP